MKIIIAIFTYIITLNAFNTINAKSNNFSEIKPQTEVTNSIKSLRSEILKMVELLERNNIKSSEEFIKKYAIPNQLKKIIEEEGFQEIIKNFHEKKRMEIIKTLKSTSKIDPQIANEGNQYKFIFADDFKDIRDVTFIWNNDAQQFYIEN